MIAWLKISAFEKLFWLFCVAGNETVRNALPGGMLALLQHPEEYRRLREDRSLLAQFWSWLDGGRADIIQAPAGGSRQPAPSREEIDAGRHRLAMNGAAVREVLVPFTGGPAIEAALAKAGWRFDELDLVTLHEANLTLNASIVKMWRDRGFRGEVLDAGGRFGNTTSASIPLALALHPAALSVGRRFGLFGFGGGLSASFALGTIRHPLETWAESEGAPGRA